MGDSMSTIINATTTNGVVIQPDNSGSLQLATNSGTTAVTIDTSQRVGIGTASPTGKLQVSGAGGVSGSTNLVYVDVTSSYGGISLNSTANNNTFVELLEAGTKVGGFNADTTNNVTSIQSAGGHALAFNTGGTTEHMRIDSSGILLVGKTTAGDTVSGFQVSSNGVPVSTCNSNSYVFYNNVASAYRFFITAAGTINATNTTITGISDQRVKENIVDLDDGLDSVMALKPRKFDWKAGKGRNIKGDRGFIAQEFETVFPDMIEEWLDPVPEGEEPYKAVNANLIPTLVKAIQEQQTIINDLKARIETLEAK